jgi:hypothetical protein
MNPREGLIDVLIGGAEVSAGAAARLESEKAWPAVLDLAATWCVIPNLRQRVTELRIPVPADLKHRLFALFEEAFVSSTLQARRGASVCRQLEEKGFPVAVFKGLASIAHLHQGNPSARTIKDVDILVREKDLDPVLEIMQGLGLKPDHGGDFSQYAAFVRNSPGFAGNEAVAVGDNGLAELDVHWSLGPRTAAEFRVEAIVERSEWVNLFGERIRVVSPADGLLLSAHHAVRENFAPDGMLRDVLDTFSWMKVLGQRGQLETCLARARLCRIEDPVLALAEILAAKGAGVHPPVPLSPQAAKLAQLFWLQVRNGQMGKDLAYLADPHSIRQILRGALSGWAGYAAFMNAFETKLTGEPLPLRRRLSGLARQLSRYGHAWKMIRALAKTKSAYQRGA